MSIKLTGLFESDFAGWSETQFYVNAQTETYKSLADDFVKNRLEVLGTYAWLNVVRVSDTDKPSFVSVFKYGNKGLAKLSDDKAAKDAWADSPYLSALLPFRSTVTNRKLYLTLSGVPDNWASRTVGDTFTLSAYGNKKFRAYMSWLTRGDYKVQFRERKKDANDKGIDIGDIEEDESGYYKITVLNTDGLDPTKKVVFNKLKGDNLSRLRGIRRIVDVPTPLHFLVDRGPYADPPPISYKGGGKYFVYDIAYNVVNKVDDETIVLSSRKRGRPFAARRGRQSVKR